MKVVEEHILFAEEELILTNQRVVYWPRKNALILSDLHLGKAAHFRRNGIPMPVQISLQDINRLEFLIHYYQPEYLIIVGDLIHAGMNQELDLFRNLIQKYPQVNFILIKGNHDRISFKTLYELGIKEVYDELILDNLHFIHHPENSDNYTISGHIHPGVNIEFATKKMRFPCYTISENQLILPAFSTFTGLDTSSELENRICYAFHDDGFFKLKT